MDTNNGYANALVGNFQNYAEGKRVMGDWWFTNIEFYLQDSWRVSRARDAGSRRPVLPHAAAGESQQ